MNKNVSLDEAKATLSECIREIERGKSGHNSKKMMISWQMPTCKLPRLPSTMDWN